MIKNLLFDFGDVFINLDKMATLNILKEAGYLEIAPELIPLMHEYEKGLIATKTFVRSALDFFPGMTADKLISAWNAIILDFPENRLEFIRALSEKRRHRLFLFSNTNELHIQKVMEQMGPARYGKFRSCFEGFYLSHEVHRRKPEPAVFNMVIRKHKLVPAETLFVDDTLEHIESAGRLGLKTWHLQVGKEEVTDLKRHL